MWLHSTTAHKNVNVKADQLQTHQNQKTRNDLMTFFPPSLLSPSLSLLNKKKSGANKKPEISFEDWQDWQHLSTSVSPPRCKKLIQAKLPKASLLFSCFQREKGKFELRWNLKYSWIFIVNILFLFIWKQGGGMWISFAIIFHFVL